MEENDKETVGDTAEDTKNEQNAENIKEVPDLQEAIKEAVGLKANARQATAAAAYAQAAKEAGSVIEEAADENVTVEDETEVLKKELADTESSLKRLRADFENFRRRTAKEKEEVGQVAKEEFIRALLPLIDNFGRAMAADKDSDNFYQGISMIAKQFSEILQNQGLEEINAAGAMFDPNYHQAVGRVQNDTLPEGAIAAVLQTGYQVNGKVIRPAMVQVVGE